MKKQNLSFCITSGVVICEHMLHLSHNDYG